MSLRLLDTTIALLLAAGFASAGELAIGRLSRTLAEWNESFLAGLGLSTAILILASAIVPGRALTIVLVLLAATLVVAGIRRRSIRPAGIGRDLRAEAPRDRVVLSCLALAAAIVAAFAVLNLRLPFAWDGFQIWATKAKVLHFQGGLTRLLFSEAEYDGRIVTYPNAVPMYEAMINVLRGKFGFGSVKGVFLVFYLSLAVGCITLARSLLPPREAWIALVLLLALPGISLGHNIGGYADMPLAAAVAAAAAACMRARTDARAARAAPWLIGTLPHIKSEGMVLAAVLVLAVGVFFLFERRAALLRALPRLALSAGIVGMLCLAQVLYVRWTRNPDPTYAPVDWAHIAQAPAVLPIIARGCLRHFGSVRDWIFLWPAFAIGAVVLAFRGSRVERLLAGACAVVLAAYAGIFLFTTWDVALHVDNSYGRLVEQVAPLAVVSVVAAWRRLAEGFGPILRPAADEQLKVARKHA